MCVCVCLADGLVFHNSFSVASSYCWSRKTHRVESELHTDGHTDSRDNSVEGPQTCMQGFDLIVGVCI